MDSQTKKICSTISNFILLAKFAYGLVSGFYTPKNFVSLNFANVESIAPKLILTKKPSFISKIQFDVSNRLKLKVCSIHLEQFDLSFKLYMWSWSLFPSSFINIRKKYFGTFVL